MSQTQFVRAADFALKAVDGKIYSLKDFSDKKALIIIFTCNHCPYVQAYEDRIIALQKDYAAQAVQIVAINSNDSAQYSQDSFESMVQRSAEKSFNFPYLHDADQSVARAYGATHTPHIFLFDSFGILRYTGKIDDDWKNPSNVRRQFLREALDSVLADQTPLQTQTYAIGCSIKWKKNG